MTLPIIGFSLDGLPFPDHTGTLPPQHAFFSESNWLITFQVFPLALQPRSDATFICGLYSRLTFPLALVADSPVPGNTTDESACQHVDADTR